MKLIEPSKLTFSTFEFDHQFDNHLYEGILPLIRTNNSYVCAIDCYKVLQN